MAKSEGKQKYHLQYSKEIADYICMRVQTQSLNSLINEHHKEPDFPSRQGVYNWLHKHQEFRQAYIEAIKIRALFRAEELDEIKEDMRSGKIDFNVARVWIDATKWQTAKENPTVFGDKPEKDNSDFSKILSALIEKLPQ